MSLLSRAWCNLLWASILLGVRLKSLRAVETGPEKTGLHSAVCVLTHCQGSLCPADPPVPSAKSIPENWELYYTEA